MAAKPDLREYLKKTQERFARPASHAYSVSGQHGMCARAAERGKDKRVRGANGACARHAGSQVNHAPPSAQLAKDPWAVPSGSASSASTLEVCACRA
jgi:hypothetical protein